MSKTVSRLRIYKKALSLACFLQNAAKAAGEGVTFGFGVGKSKAHSDCARLFRAQCLVGKRGAVKPASYPEALLVQPPPQDCGADTLCCKGKNAVSHLSWQQKPDAAYIHKLFS